MHMKVVIVDGRFAYVGSANLTGAGLGAKSPTRRNFEAGYTTTHVDEIDRLMEFVDALYLGGSLHWLREAGHLVRSHSRR